MNFTIPFGLLPLASSTIPSPLAARVPPLFPASSGGGKQVSTWSKFAKGAKVLATSGSIIVAALHALLSSNDGTGTALVSFPSNGIKWESNEKALVSFPSNGIKWESNEKALVSLPSDLIHALEHEIYKIEFKVPKVTNYPETSSLVQIDRALTAATKPAATKPAAIARNPENPLVGKHITFTTQEHVGVQFDDSEDSIIKPDTKGQIVEIRLKPDGSRDFFIDVNAYLANKPQCERINAIISEQQLHTNLRGDHIVVGEPVTLSHRSQTLLNDDQGNGSMFGGPDILYSMY